MQLNYSVLKKKKVVNVIDGKELGKINDLVMSFPDGKVLALIVGKRALFAEDELIINLCCVNKIGDDAVLVSLREPNVGCVSCTDETIE